MENAMAEYKFGYWECTHEYPGEKVSVRPASDFEQAKSLACQQAQRGEVYFMPHIQKLDGGGCAPADRFELPITHVLSIPGRPQDRQLGEFMVLVLGFLHGLRFTVEGDGHLFRTPHRQGTLVSFNPGRGKRALVGPFPEHGEIRFRAEHAEAIRCMETALDTWDGLDASKRKLLFAAIHWYLVGQSYPHQFERFSWQYSVLDNLYRFGKPPTENDAFHPQRPQKLSEQHEVHLPLAFKDLEMNKLRNNLVHEARWLGEPIGYAATQDGHEIIMALTYFNSQVILGALGIECAFRKQPYGSLQIAPLGLQE